MTRDFLTRNVCSESFGRVVEEQRYVVTFDVVDPWYDSTLATNPEGLGVGDFPWGLGYLAAPFRRVIDARYLQPCPRIRPDCRQRTGSGRTSRSIRSRSARSAIPSRSTAPNSPPRGAASCSCSSTTR